MYKSPPELLRSPSALGRSTPVLAQNSKKQRKHSVSRATAIPSPACSRFCPPSVSCSRSDFVIAARWSSNSSPCDIRQPSCAVNTLGCTIATSVAQPELFAVTEPALPLRSGVSPPAIAWLGCRRAQSPCAETALQESGALFDSRISPTAIFIDRIPGRMDF